MNIINFFVAGIPRPGGSKRAYVNRFTGRAAVAETGKHTPAWRSDVKDAAAKAIGNRPLLDGPLKLTVRFVFPRPKKHFTKSGLRPDAPHYHTSAPDTTKCLRSLEDALKGVLWVDDSRVALQLADKRYGDKPGALITVEPLDNTLKQREQQPRTEQPLLNGLKP